MPPSVSNVVAGPSRVQVPAGERSLCHGISRLLAEEVPRPERGARRFHLVLAARVGRWGAPVDLTTFMFVLCRAQERTAAVEKLFLTK